MSSSARTSESDASELRRRLVDLGLDVHDGPLQELGALRLDLYLFRAQMAGLVDRDGDGARLLGRVADLTARLESAEEELRELAAIAGSSTLLEGPISEALERTVTEHARGRPLLLDLDPAIDTAAMDDALRIALLRIVQAAVSNIVQHSGARSGRIAARVRGDEIVVEVHDDGRGFDVPTRAAAAWEDNHLGLFGMRDRVSRVGGELTITSKPGAGTLVCVRARLRGESAST